MSRIVYTCTPLVLEIPDGYVIEAYPLEEVEVCINPEFVTRSVARCKVYRVYRDRFEQIGTIEGSPWEYDMILWIRNGVVKVLADVQRPVRLGYRVRWSGGMRDLGNSLIGEIVDGVIYNLSFYSMYMIGTIGAWGRGFDIEMDIHGGISKIWDEEFARRFMEEMRGLNGSMEVLGLPLLGEYKGGVRVRTRSGVSTLIFPVGTAYSPRGIHDAVIATGLPGINDVFAQCSIGFTKV